MDQTFLPLALLITITLVLLARGLCLRAGVLKYPFLASAVMLGWFIPQAIGLSDDVTLPRGGFSLTMIMAAICLLATVFGERWVKPVSQSPIQYNRRSLLIGAAALSTIGLIAYGRIFTTPVELTDQGFTTGTVTILFFFSQLQYFGLAIAVLLLLQKFSWAACAIVATDLNAILGFVLFGGRRGPAIDLLTIFACALWFQRRILPPRLLMLAGIALAALFGNSIGNYRSLVMRINPSTATGESRLPTLDEVLEVKYVEQFTQTLEEGSFEVRNAIMYIASTDVTGKFDFGAAYWNYLVFRFIPAQILGADFKRGLMFDLPDDSVEVFGYQRHPGTTFTGFADAFIGFWFFGGLIFAGIAAVLEFWWKRANAGHFDSQLWYCLLIGTSMEGVTHATQWVLAYVVQVAVFLLPVLYLSRSRSPFQQSTKSFIRHRPIASLASDIRR